MEPLCHGIATIQPTQLEFSPKALLPLCQEGVGRRGVNQINVCLASRMLVIFDQDSNLCDHIRDSQNSSLLFIFENTNTNSTGSSPMNNGIAREGGRTKLTELESHICVEMP